LNLLALSNYRGILLTTVRHSTKSVNFRAIRFFIITRSLKRVKLKSSFDKSWGDINEKCNDGLQKNLGKTGSGKCELLSQKFIVTFLRVLSTPAKAN